MKMYQNPLVERYSSKEMLEIFSPLKKFTTWRKLWLALAEAERELGLDISEEQIAELAGAVEDIDFEMAAAFEKEVRHDVMAHVLTLGAKCPASRPIIHLGATSAFVGDNTDIVVMREALVLVARKIAILIDRLAEFAEQYRSLPTLGFTHFQPAQLTTVGKRAALWVYDFVMDLEDVEACIASLKLRGVKGTTGTQASFLNLFDGDHDKVTAVEKLVAAKMGFDATYPVTGQTYSRKVDAKVLSVLAGIAASLHKVTNDLRLLQSLKEIEEPFEKNQIGSSAMAYKRNPMRSERIASLSKLVISLSISPLMVASTQWFERTLDDSANKRLAVSEAFLAIDAALDIANNVTAGLQVYPRVIDAHIQTELPFMATENIIMEAVKRGGDRQELHERIRMHSMESARMIKQEGRPNDLIDRIAADPIFGLDREELAAVMRAENYIGRSAEQVAELIESVVEPIRCRYRGYLGAQVELKV